MSLFKKNAGPAAPAARAQLRRGIKRSLGAAHSLDTLIEGDAASYRAIREAVPIVDAAIGKIIRLSGGLRAACEDAGAEAALNRFLATVNTGRGQRGLQSFLDCYLDSMLTCGRAVGEIVTDGTKDIAAVLCGDVSTVLVREGDSPLDFCLCDAGSYPPAPFPYQDLLLFTPFAPETEHPYGVSLLRSMPYMVGILSTIYESIRSNFERSGNVRYALSYRPGDGALDRANAPERLKQIAEEWSAAMQSGRHGAVRDFVAMGDVEIRTVGADAKMPETETPVRQILEQLVSKTGIPPFLLGLSWSSTERMSSQQADVMTSEIAAIRRSLTTVVTRVCDLWMAIHGYDAPYEIVWDDINLQDEVEEAKARWYGAQALKLEEETKA